MRNSRKRIKRIRRRTLKMRGGDLDDPDTKDFMNSKIEALEQKIAELESNMLVQIGYKKLSFGSGAIGHSTFMPLFVNKNISVEDFWRYVNKGNQNNPNNTLITIFLPVLYSLQNIRGLKTEDCKYSFNAEGREDYENLNNNGAIGSVALNAKYPGLFVVTPPTNTSYSY
jgi:hypothetical protein